MWEVLVGKDVTVVVSSQSFSTHPILDQESNVVNTLVNLSMRTRTVDIAYYPPTHADLITNMMGNLRERRIIPWCQ